MTLPLDAALDVSTLRNEIRFDAFDNFEKRVQFGGRDVRNRSKYHGAHLRDHLVAQASSFGRQMDAHSAPVVRVAHALDKTVHFHVIESGYCGIWVNTDLCAQFSLI